MGMQEVHQDFDGSESHREQGAHDELPNSRGDFNEPIVDSDIEEKSHEELTCSKNTDDYSDVINDFLGVIGCPKLAESPLETSFLLYNYPSLHFKDKECSEVECNSHIEMEESCITGVSTESVSKVHVMLEIYNTILNQINKNIEV